MNPRTPHLLLGALLLAAAPVLLFATVVRADDETPPAPAPAPGTPPASASSEAPEGFAPENYPLLPIGEEVRDRLVHGHPELVTRLTILSQRAERVMSHLRERPDPTDDGSKRLIEELTRIRAQFGPLTAEARTAFLGYGMEPDAFDLVKTAAKGPLREERYAHALVLKAPDVSPEARTILERLVPAVDGGLLALHGQRKGAEGTPEAEAAAKEIERRFWRTVDVLLDDGSRRWVHRRLPGNLMHPADAIGHVYRLTGLTPSQGSQIKALLVELDSEAAADGAEVKRIEARLKEQDVSESERGDLERAKNDAQRRLIELRLDLYRRGKAILTDAQYREYEAIPPEVTTADRQRNPKEIVDALDLDPAQQQALAALRVRYEGEKHRVEMETLAVQKKQQELGADSPEQEMMMMEYVGIQNHVQAVIRRATREIFLSILTPDQILGWVLGAPK
jgi:hypothetical protein